MDTPTPTPPPVTLASLLAGPHASPSWVRWCGSLRLSAFLHPDGYHVAIVDYSGPVKRGLCVVEGVGSSGRTIEQCAHAALYLALTGEVAMPAPGPDRDALRRTLEQLLELDADRHAVVSEQPLAVEQTPPPRDAPQTAPPVAVDGPPYDSTPVTAPEAPAKKKRQRRGSSAPKEVK